MLRQYQEDVLDRCDNYWEQGVNSVLMVLPTGAGKTKAFSTAVQRRDQTSMVIAHRQELVLQMSESLAREGVFHRVIAPTPVQKFCAKRHMEVFGRSYVEPNAKVSAVGVQTLLRRADSLQSYLRQVRFAVTDECHHARARESMGTCPAACPQRPSDWASPQHRCA